VEYEKENYIYGAAGGADMFVHLWYDI